MIDMAIGSVWSNGLDLKENTKTVDELDSPGFADRFGTEPIGFGIVHEFVFLEVVVELAIEAQCNVRCVAGNVREASRVGVCLRLAAGLHAIEEVANVERGRIAVDFGDSAAGQ